jgi:hypothetical protein
MMAVQVGRSATGTDDKSSAPMGGGPMGGHMQFSQGGMTGRMMPGGPVGHHAHMMQQPGQGGWQGNNGMMNQQPNAGMSGTPGGAGNEVPAGMPTDPNMMQMQQQMMMGPPVVMMMQQQMFMMGKTIEQQGQQIQRLEHEKKNHFQNNVSLKDEVKELQTKKDNLQREIDGLRMELARMQSSMHMMNMMRMHPSQMDKSGAPVPGAPDAGMMNPMGMAGGMPMDPMMMQQMMMQQQQMMMQQQMMQGRQMQHMQGPHMQHQMQMQGQHMQQPSAQSTSQQPAAATSTTADIQAAAPTSAVPSKTVVPAPAAEAAQAPTPAPQVGASATPTPPSTAAAAVARPAAAPAAHLNGTSDAASGICCSIHTPMRPFAHAVCDLHIVRMLNDRHMHMHMQCACTFSRTTRLVLPLARGYTLLMSANSYHRSNAVPVTSRRFNQAIGLVLVAAADRAPGSVCRGASSSARTCAADGGCTAGADACGRKASNSRRSRVDEQLEAAAVALEEDHGPPRVLRSGQHDAAAAREHDQARAGG